MNNIRIRTIEKKSKIINVYNLPNNFRVETETAEGETDFYLCHKSYGDKMHMYGISHCTAEAEVQFIMANVEEYIEIFNKRFV